MVHPRILAWHNGLEQQESLTKGLNHVGDEWSDMDADDAEEAYWG
jgi:hypothetical protein